MEVLNKTVKKKDFFQSICYGATFLLILLSMVYKNERVVFYSFEVMYIFIIVLEAIKNNSKVSKYTLWSAIFFTICLVSYTYALDKNVAFKQIFNLLKTLLVCNSLLFFINNDEVKLNFILKSIIISALYLSVLLVISTPSYEWGNYRLGNSVSLNSNDLGLKMTISSIISVYFGKKNKIQYYFLAAIFSIITLLSGSRKAFIMLIIGIMLLSILNLKKKKYLLIIIPGLMFFVYGAWKLIVVVPYFYNVLGIRVEMMINGILGHGDVDNSTLTRLQMIDYGIELFKQRPFFGYGIFNYSSLTSYAYSHNNYIELLVGVGIVGTVIYYSLYIYIIYKLLKTITNNNYAVLFVSLILGLAIMEYGLVSYYEEIYEILIVCGYSAITIKKTKGNRKPIVWG